MIPTYGSLPAKSQRIVQEAQEKGLKLEQLVKKIHELKKFERFSEESSEINQLLEESEDQCLNVENIYFIDITINKINRLIETLSQPVKNKINQLEFLIKLIEKYFDQTQINNINNVFNKYKNKLQEELNAKEINKNAINKSLGEIDQCLTTDLKKIKKQMLDYFKNKEVINLYEYKSKIIQFFENNDDYVKTKENNKLSDNEFLVDSITKLDISYQHFEFRLAWINFYKETYEIINTYLLDLDEINIKKSEILKLINDINSFNPNVDSFNILDKKFNLLGDKLKELQELNKINLKEQHTSLIDQLKDSKTNLAIYAEKLKSSWLWVKSGRKKYEVIENIQQKIDILLKYQENQEQTTPNQESITKLQQTINEAKAIVSEYRGISLLRCFATLWGGGKVTSQLLVETLEEQLIDLQSNFDKLSLSR